MKNRWFNDVVVRPGGNPAETHPLYHAKPPGGQPELGQTGHFTILFKTLADNAINQYRQPRPPGLGQTQLFQNI